MNKHLGKGLIQVYTGNGKGKTTAAFGQAIRSAGHGLHVEIVQFAKGGGITGEFLAVKQFLPQIRIRQFGRQCIHKDKIEDNGVQCRGCLKCFMEESNEADRQIVLTGIRWIENIIKQESVDLLLMDEIAAVINLGLVCTQTVLDLLKQKNPYTEIILTGREMPEEILQKAHLITEMKQIKHPYQLGFENRWGIDY